MGSNRLSLSEEQVTAGQVTGAAFTAVPAMLLGVMHPAAFQQQLYQWAFEQARQAVQVRRFSPFRDLFTIMN